MSSSAYATLAIVVLGLLYVWFKQIKIDHPQQPDPDKEVLEQLRSAGSNMSKPHKIDFFLYAPSESVAIKMKEVLLSKGFSAQVKKSEKGHDWLCQGFKEMIPSYDSLLVIRSEFTELTKKYGGQYDGWGCPVEP